MCLIATYTEIEKANQISKVKNLMANGKFQSEAELKNFLYNLSVMNNMVVKGYCKERTAEDYNIYQMKDECLLFLAVNYPERCRCGSSVLYVYSSSRQYSYHFRNFHMDFFKIRQARENEWNNIHEAYKLSDSEYQKRVKRHHNPVKIDWRKELGDMGVYGYIKKMYSYTPNDPYFNVEVPIRRLLHDNIVREYMFCQYHSDSKKSHFMAEMAKHVVSWRCREYYNQQDARLIEYKNKRSQHFMDDLAAVAKIHKNIRYTKAWKEGNVKSLFSRYAEKFGIDEGNGSDFGGYCKSGFPETIVYYGTDKPKYRSSTVEELAYRFYNRMKNDVDVHNLTCKNYAFKIVFKHYFYDLELI